MVEGFIAAANLSSHAFSECEIYSAWESDAVIAHELIRNLGLAFACIATITLVMLVNLRLCFFVLLTVLLTLVDVIGTSHLSLFLSLTSREYKLNGRLHYQSALWPKYRVHNLLLPLGWIDLNFE